jgi:hypothetical protein
MFKEWRVTVLFQMDPQSSWEKVHDKFFDSKEDAEKFKAQYPDNGFRKAYLYHYEPSWTNVED